MKKILLVLLAAMLTTSLAYADWDKSIALNSDNRIRGISENQANPGLVFDINQKLNNGFYVGTRVPTVSGSLGYGFHVDAYGGYKFELLNGLTIDIGSMNYLFPKVTKYVTNEIYTNVSYSIFTIKANRSLGDYFSYPESRGSTYYELGVNYPITDTLTGHARIGKIRIANNNLFNYTTQQLALSYNYDRNWTVTGTYINNKNLTDIAKQYGYIENGHDLWRNTLVVSLKRTF